MTAGARSADVDRLIAQQALQHVAVSARGAGSSLVRSRRLLRRRRNKLEYFAPSGPETVDATEARDAVRLAEVILEQAEALVPMLRRHGS